MPDKERGVSLRKIPKVDELLAAKEVQELSHSFPHEVVVEGIRRVLEGLRQEILTMAKPAELPAERFTIASLLPPLREEVAGQVAPRLKQVINATGVIIHTNLGRSPLSERALEEVAQIARGYSNLEYDLAQGERGSRYAHVEQLLLRLTGAEGGLVVNNNAGAVLLTINTIAANREVVCSRGELVEIGGAFRIPDVMAKSNALLREVGTTNRTRLKDYEAAINNTTALLLKVHTSNFRVVGFTEEVSLVELVALGRKRSLPVMDDLGSGCLLDLTAYGLAKEPTVQETVATGVDAVTFSGDKLLGGPQAGIIVGKKEWIDRIKANPMARALRIDKLTLAALEATLIAYLSDAGAIKEIPTLRMLTVSDVTLREQAEQLHDLLQQEKATAAIAVIEETSEVGGGALPLQGLPTWAVAIKPLHASLEALEKALRQLDPSIIARIANNRLILDVRTIQADEIPVVAHGVAQALKKIGAAA
jgi:L-seryl-tRNA(Ser) seleniumtransferase